MNFTYLASSPFPLPATPGLNDTPPSGPIIIMTLNPQTRKSHNLLQNPRVSMLVHDWVSPRRSLGESGSDAPATPTSGLAAFLTNLNTAEIGRISATLNGFARVVPEGTEEEKWYWEKHLEKNPSLEGSWRVGEEGGVRVVVVRVGWARVSDWKGSVSDWVAGDGGWEEEGSVSSAGAAGAAVINGVV